MHEHDPVGDALRKAHLVGDHHHGHAARRQLLELQHFAGELRVERGGDLVEQHHLRLHRQRAGDRGALLLAAGKLLGIGVQPCREPDLRQHLRASALRLARGHAASPQHGASVMFCSTVRCGNRL